MAKFSVVVHRKIFTWNKQCHIYLYQQGIGLSYSKEGHYFLRQASREMKTYTSLNTGQTQRICSEFFMHLVQACKMFFSFPRMLSFFKKTKIGEKKKKKTSHNIKYLLVIGEAAFVKIFRSWEMISFTDHLNWN